MKIIGYTYTYNEEELAPYVLPYIEAMGYDKLIVYDNNSTDRTVEILSKYDFVEVRYFDMGVFDAKRVSLIQKEAFLECSKMANIGAENEELVWMVWIDFDEVLFYNTDEDFKPILEGDYYNRGYNAFYKTMVNLLPPKGRNELLSEVKYGKKMVHECNNIRGCIWHGGSKPTMIAVNDFREVYFAPGNHYMFAKMREGRTLKNYSDCCRLYGFHLKYIDKNILINKWKGYADKGREEYLRRIEDIDGIMDKLYSVSFPLEEYFLQDYFNSALFSEKINFNGISVI